MYLQQLQSRSRADQTLMRKAKKVSGPTSGKVKEDVSVQGVRKEFKVCFATTDSVNCTFAYH